MTGPALLPTASGGEVARLVARAARDRRLALAGAILTTATGSAAGLGGPAAIGLLTQSVIDHAAVGALAVPAIVLVLSGLLGGAAAWASAALLARAVLPPAARVREDAMAAALALPADAVEDGGSGDLVSRLSGDVERVTDAAQGALGSFVTAAITILVTLAGLGALDWRFAVAGLLAVPIQLATLRWYRGASRPVYAAGRRAEGARAAALLETFAALPTVRAFGLAGWRRRLVARSSAEAMELEFAATRVSTRFFGRLNAAEFVGLSAILVVGLLLVRDHEATVGEATTAALFFAGLFDPINTVLGVVDQLQQAGAGLARLVGVIGAARPAVSGSPTPAAARTPVSPTARPDADTLVADAVGFRFPSGVDAVVGVSMTLPPGTHVAIVGATGSGKSTLAAMLAGLRIPTSGSVRLGNAVPSPATGRVGMIAQETHVFAGTIAENLRLAGPDAGEAQLWTALRDVRADGWVAALPDRLSTVVGAGGLRLTAENAQHLAFARLRLLDPALVVLDEATAESGSGAARVLDAAARAVVAGRSAVIVAHRLDQAASADLVLVMDHGRVVERGRHEELIARGGRYARLWRSWSGERDPLSPAGA
ncbi:MAG TPA: ABC transporter ATP-binding protein [Cellulomonas sp.]